jgi:hypothetical protein
MPALVLRSFLRATNLRLQFLDGNARGTSSVTFRHGEDSVGGGKRVRSCAQGRSTSVEPAYASRSQGREFIIALPILRVVRGFMGHKHLQTHRRTGSARFRIRWPCCCASPAQLLALLRRARLADPFTCTLSHPLDFAREGEPHPANGDTLRCNKAPGAKAARV